MRLDERFARAGVLGFLRLLGLAVVLDVATEVHAGVWRVHTGELYPWRHLGLVPLYGPAGLALEWTTRLACGLAIALLPSRVRVLRVALRLLVLALFAAALERYSNHGVLLLLVALFTSLAPPDPTDAELERAAHPALGLVRAQLVIVYAFSALNKLTHGFTSGASLVNLLHVPLAAARPLSWAVVAAEVAIPLLLLARPRAGVAAVVLLHASFAILVPNVGSFSLTMIAMSLLFVPARTTSGPARSADRRPG